MFKPLARLAVTLGLMTASSWAAPILGVTVTANATDHAGTLPSQIYDGSGLPGNIQDPTAIHASGTETNLSAVNSLTPTYSFNLNGLYSISGMAIWNFNGVSSAGIQGVSVESSLDGVSFTAIPGSPSVFAIGRYLLPVSAQVFTWDPVLATHIRFVVSSNYGFSATGLSEVLFDGTVPEMNPQTAMQPLTIVCLALLVLGTIRKPVPTAAT